MFTQYLETIKTIRTNNTYVKYKQILYLFKDKPATVETAMEFIKDNPQISTNTQKMYLAIWYGALEFNGNTNRELDYFIKGLKTEERIQPTPTEIEVESCINATDIPAFKLVIALMSYAGLRISEVLKIRRYDIQGNKIRIRQPKNHAERYAVISNKLKPYLSRYLKQCLYLDAGYLFTNQATKRLYTTDHIKKVVKETCKKAGYPELHCHSFRHYFATTLYKKSGFNLQLTAKACGHKSINTTIRYIGATADDVLQVANMF